MLERNVQHAVTGSLSCPGITISFEPLVPLLAVFPDERFPEEVVKSDSLQCPMLAPRCAFIDLLIPHDIVSPLPYADGEEVAGEGFSPIGEAAFVRPLETALSHSAVKEGKHAFLLPDARSGVIARPAFGKS
jgi:hypothetical protein